MVKKKFMSSSNIENSILKDCIDLYNKEVEKHLIDILSYKEMCNIGEKGFIEKSMSVDLSETIEDFYYKNKKILTVRSGFKNNQYYVKCERS